MSAPGVAGLLRMTSGVKGSALTGSALPETLVELQRLIDLEEVARRRKDERRKMLHVGARHHHLGERIVLQLGEEVEPGGAIQIVEPVAVLQVLELGLEHEVERRAEHAAERHFLLGQAADPQVDIVEAGRW